MVRRLTPEELASARDWAENTPDIPYPIRQGYLTLLDEITAQKAETLLARFDLQISNSYLDEARGEIDRIKAVIAEYETGAQAILDTINQEVQR